MYRALVIDDEPRACHVLEILVGKYLPEITAFKTALSPREGISLIRSFKPHLVFLDVEMPVLNGFDVLNAIDDWGASRWDFEVIFTTAYHQFALQAIKVSALDYLLKPIDIDELRIAFDKFLRRQPQLIPPGVLIKNLVHNLKTPNPTQHKLPIPTTEGIHLLTIADIIRCEADNNYTFFYLTENRRFCASKTLKEFETMLREHDFVRVHKSHLVNLQFVEQIDRDGTVQLTNGTAIMMSRRVRQSFFSKPG
ncbi:LytR/AlgR family response regulator transcription factor [Larkinella sp.]|uniref:LytR/AlgR family response regulator transcription factor n=1 Tax=Larkinella sp. TaxID=2034517 RepID=UPI003BACA3A0